MKTLLIAILLLVSTAVSVQAVAVCDYYFNSDLGDYIFVCIEDGYIWFPEN